MVYIRDTGYRMNLYCDCNPVDSNKYDLFKVSEIIATILEWFK